MLERKPLAGRVIAVPESRQLEKLSAMLEEKGATALRYPLVTIRDAPSAPVIEAWLKELCEGSFDDLILLTGEGLSRLLGFARRAAMHDEVASALAKLRTIARGPKACRALRDMGLLPTVTVDNPTTDGVIDALGDHGRLIGRTVAVQLYGQEPNARLTKYLERSGARVRTVAPYVYVGAIDDDRAFDLIDRLANGSVDTIAFTSSRQIDRLFEVAESRAAGMLLRAGLARTRIAAVGPVAATSLRKRGFRIDIVPESSFFLRSLVHEVIAAFR